MARRSLQLAPRLFFHALQPGVVVSELVEVRERDLAGQNRVVVGDVRRGIVKAMLQLHLEPPAELIDVERRGVPVDASLLTDLPRLLGGEALAWRHLALSPGRWTKRI